MGRDRGDVYKFAFPDDIGEHPVVIVSRPTKRSTVLAAFVTSTSQPSAPDVVPVASMECASKLKGFVRCDQIYLLIADAPEWKRYLFRMSDADMALIEAGLKAALELS